MEVKKTVNDEYVCIMSRDEFVGLFRTIGKTSQASRQEKPFDLTPTESEFVSAAYSKAWDIAQELLDTDLE